jgi:hypothetical protein
MEIKRINVKNGKVGPVDHFLKIYGEWSYSCTIPDPGTGWR